jgi:hypothetical protein
VAFTGARLTKDGVEVQMPAKSVVVLQLRPDANAGHQQAAVPD